MRHVKWSKPRRFTPYVGVVAALCVLCPPSLIAASATSVRSPLGVRSVTPARSAARGNAGFRRWALTRDAAGGLHVTKFSPTSLNVNSNAASIQGQTVGAIEVDQPVKATEDTYESQQWGLGAAGFPTAWSGSVGGNVIVAVIDSGVRATHQDLAGAVLHGVDFVASGGDGSDDQNGHGTHVAGIIAARRNGIGVVGAAPGTRILPIRVLDASGSGMTSDVAAGIIYAADHGARVVNLSLGGPSPSAAMQTAIQYANSKGTIVFAAAGNYAQNGNPVTYPAAYPEAVAVAAVDSFGNRAAFSSYGSYVDLAAPGVGILSAWGNADNAYASASGTSMATPFAAAAAALVIAAHPTLTVAEVRNRLESTATDIGPAGNDIYTGHGLINPAVAMQGGNEGNGYWVVGANGRVQSYGGAHGYGDLSHTHLQSAVVASATTASGHGYWLTTAEGHVYVFGDAKFSGDMRRTRLWSPIVAMAPTPSGKGYWLLGGDGGVFSFGDAKFHGSTGGIPLTSPVVDIAPTRTGRGYWFVAADGGVFSFGDAKFRGSTGGRQLWQPITSITAAASGRGYWLIARDGGVFAFGVPFHGSLAVTPNAASFGAGVRVRALASGRGYYILTSNGTALPFGTARRFGGTKALGSFAVDLMVAN